MTTPNEDDDQPQGRAADAGALAAASEDHEEAGDPLAPLDRLTEDDPD